MLPLSSRLYLLRRLPVTYFFYLSFNNACYRAVPTQDVTNPGSLPIIVGWMFLSSLTLEYFFISDFNDATDLLDPSPAPHFITF